MLLIVTIKCARCGATGEVHVAGEWDIHKVTHECAPSMRPDVFSKMKEVDITAPRMRGNIRVKFKPERSIY